MNREKIREVLEGLYVSAAANTIAPCIEYDHNKTRRTIEEALAKIEAEFRRADPLREEPAPEPPQEEEG